MGDDFAKLSSCLKSSLYCRELFGSGEEVGGRAAWKLLVMPSFLVILEHYYLFTMFNTLL